MLQNLEQKKLKANIKLYWGNRKQEEFFNISDFQYIDLETTFCLSQESIQNFYYGYIQDAFLETKIGDIKSVIPYICGSENMIESVTNLIRKLGYSGPINLIILCHIRVRSNYEMCNTCRWLRHEDFRRN